MTARGCLLLLLTLSGFAAPGRSLAQTSVVLEGRVVNAAADPVRGAEVTAHALATGERRRILTSTAGEFRLLGLQSGSYRVALHAAGYQPAAQDVELVIGQRAHITIVLEQAAAELDSLVVIARPMNMEIARTTVSTPVHELEMRNLPLATRKAMDLAAIAPGIRAFRPIAGRGLPAAGATRGERFVNLYLDGLALKSLYDGNLIGAPQWGSPFPAEALKEFRVYLNPYDAEYAHAAAYLINAVTHRGTNERHTSVFGMFQNGSLVSSTGFLDALPNASRPDFQRQQLGFNARGPLRRDRLFYAASYELSNKRDFVAVVPGRPAFDPGYWDAHAGTFEAPDRNHTGILRLTHTPSDASTLELTWSTKWQRNETLFGAAISHDAAQVLEETVNSVSVRHQWLPHSQLLNEASLQFIDWVHDSQPLVLGPQLTYPTLQIGRIESKFAIRERHFRFVNRATRPAGAHLLKAGVEVGRVTGSNLNARGALGAFEFARETDTLPVRATIAVGVRHPGSNRDARAELAGWVYGAYVSDEWRPVPRLVLNLGVRYDAAINTLNNHFMVPWADDPELKSLPAVRPYLNRGNRRNDLDNVAPRMSVSWDVLGDARTFLRAGLGIMYDHVPAFIGYDERRDATWRTYVFNQPGTADPEVLRQRIASGTVAVPPSIRLVSLDMEAPDSRQWSVGVGRQLTPQLGVNVDFIAQDVRHLFARLNLNWRDAAASPARRALTPRYGDIDVWDDLARARYRALVAQLAWQSGSARRATLAYTLGYAEADWDEQNFGVPTSVAGTFYTLQRISGDERHRIVLSGVVELRRGLTLSTVGTVASPRPYRAIVGEDRNLNSFIWDDWIDGRRYRVPSNHWRNWYRMLDVRAAHDIRLPQTARLTLIVEAFNVLNTENYASYAGRQKNEASVEIPTFGSPNGVFATRQLQIGARATF